LNALITKQLGPQKRSSTQGAYSSIDWPSSSMMTTVGVTHHFGFSGREILHCTSLSLSPLTATCSLVVLILYSTDVVADLSGLAAHGCCHTH